MRKLIQGKTCLLPLTVSVLFLAMVAACASPPQSHHRRPAGRSSSARAKNTAGAAGQSAKARPPRKTSSTRPTQNAPKRDYVAYGPIVMPKEFQSIGREKPVTGDDIVRIVTYYQGLYDIDKNLIYAVMRVESNFNTRAVSSCGAQGLMQLMPSTARSLGVTDSFHPAQNIAGGTLYLAKMVREFGNDARLVLAAYNAGPGNVKKYGGVPPFEVTQDYVDRVLRHRRRYASWEK